MGKAILGIIGGSGLYHLPGIVDLREIGVESPWGTPSDVLRVGRIGGTEIVFLPRHGPGHVFSPSDIDYRANIDAMKRAGVTDLVAISAVGSLREGFAPGTFVLADQFIDRTVSRPRSFFGAGCVAHVPFAHPVSPRLAARIERAAKEEGVAHRRGGTYVVIEGPQYSTLAESHLYRALGADVVGMTALPEARLAREAEIAYAVIAMVTDFDAWHPEHDAVNVGMVTRVARENAGKVASLVSRLARDFPAEHEPCPYADTALDGAIMTAPNARDPAVLARLDAVAGRVIGR